MKEKTITVCMISCQHQLQDDRIYWKEALLLQKDGYSVIHIGVGEKYSDEVTAHGIRLIQISRKKYSQNPIFNKILTLLSFRRGVTKDILTAAKSINAHIYHFHDWQINRIVGQLKQLPRKPIVVYDVHESYIDLIRGHAPIYLRPFYYLYALLVERCELNGARICDAIIATEPYVWKKFNTQLKDKPCELIYNYSYFLPALTETANTAKEYDIIYSGTVTAQRGIFEIVEAIKLLRQKKSDVTCLVIGQFSSNQLKQQVQQMIEVYGLSGNIYLHDAVSFQEIGSFYSRSKIGLCIVHPIKLYRNAVFIKTFEYMAFGLPVVGSNFGQIGHYIESSGAGIAIPPFNPGALSEALAKLLNSPALYAAYSNQAVKAVEHEYNWKREEKKLLHLYSHLLSILQ